MADVATMQKNDPSKRYLEKQKKRRKKLIFITYAGKTEGVIEEIHKYELKLKGREELLKKHDILFFYKPDASQGVNRILKTDQDVAGKNLQEELKYQKRLKIPGLMLIESMKKKEYIEVTLRNGHVLRGRIRSFGIFSIRLEFDKDTRVIIMRPNIWHVNFRPEEKPAETFRGNVKTNIFHSSACRYFTCEDCTAVFSTTEEALKAGYRPHGQCVK